MPSRTNLTTSYREFFGSIEGIFFFLRVFFFFYRTSLEIEVINIISIHFGVIDENKCACSYCLITAHSTLLKENYFQFSNVLQELGESAVISTFSILRALQFFFRCNRIFM